MKLIPFCSVYSHTADVRFCSLCHHLRHRARPFFCSHSSMCEIRPAAVYTINTPGENTRAARDQTRLICHANIFCWTRPHIQICTFATSAPQGLSWSADVLCSERNYQATAPGMGYIKAVRSSGTWTEKEMVSELRNRSIRRVTFFIPNLILMEMSFQFR